METEMLRPRDAAAQCAVTVRALRQMASDGRCPPPVRYGDGDRCPLRWRRSEIIAWLASGCKRWEGRDA